MKRIVVAEDDPEQRQLVAWFLRKEGYAAHEARDGVEALALIDRVRPHLLLLDFALPRLDGWSVLAQMRRSPALADVAVVGMSGLPLHMRAQSDVLVLPKPLDLARLLRVADLLTGGRPKGPGAAAAVG